MFDRVLNRTDLPLFPGIFRFRSESWTGVPAQDGFDWLTLRLASPEPTTDTFPAALTEARQQLQRRLGCQCHVYLRFEQRTYCGQPVLHPDTEPDWPAQATFTAGGQQPLLREHHGKQLAFFGQVRNRQGSTIGVWCLRWPESASVDAAHNTTLQTWHRALENALRLREAWSNRLNRELEDERLCYAAELHDTVAQTLGYLRMQSARLLGKCRPHMDERSCPIIEQIEAQSQLACRQAREIINGTRAVCRHGNLNTDIAKVVAEFESLSSLVFEQDLRFDSTPLSAEPRRHCLMMLRETLSNAVRHSRATHVRISSRLEHDAMRLCIEDNGIGLSASRPRHDSFGLQILQERAKRINAHLTVEEREAGGTRVIITLQESDFD